MLLKELITKIMGSFKSSRCTKQFVLNLGDNLFNIELFFKGMLIKGHIDKITIEV